MHIIHTIYDESGYFGQHLWAALWAKSVLLVGTLWATLWARGQGRSGCWKGLGRAWRGPGRALESAGGIARASLASPASLPPLPRGEEEGTHPGWAPFWNFSRPSIVNKLCACRSRTEIRLKYVLDVVVAVVRTTGKI